MKEIWKIKYKVIHGRHLTVFPPPLKKPTAIEVISLLSLFMVLDSFLSETNFVYSVFELTSFQGFTSVAPFTGSLCVLDKTVRPGRKNEEREGKR